MIQQIVFFFNSWPNTFQFDQLLAAYWGGPHPRFTSKVNLKQARWGKHACKTLFRSWFLRQTKTIFWSLHFVVMWTVLTIILLWFVTSFWRIFAFLKTATSASTCRFLFFSTKWTCSLHHLAGKTVYFTIKRNFRPRQLNMIFYYKMLMQPIH